MTKAPQINPGKLYNPALPKGLLPTVPPLAKVPFWPPPFGYVKITSRDLKYEITALLDEAEANLTPGAARIEKADLPWRQQGTWWSGHENDVLEVSIILDGYPRKTMEPAIEELEAMGRPVREGRASGAPKPVHVLGQVPGTDKLWWPPRIAYGKAIWHAGKRVRQHATLTFEEYELLDTVEAQKRDNQRSKSGAKKRRQPHTVRKGETLTSIAQDELGQAKRWKDIAAANPHRAGKKKTPRRSPTDLKVGEKLVMPQD